MMGARRAGLLSRLINDQMLPSILAKMPPSDWRQWAREQPAWMREAIEEAFWSFVDQKWRDALNVAATEPPSWGEGGGRTAPQGGKKRGSAEAAKLAKAAVHMTGADGRRPRQGGSSRTCVLRDVMECQGTHPPWHCKVFGKLPAKEREKIIKDNRLCPFCLLHDKDKPCGAKQRPVACPVGNCKGRHIQKLHDFLKDVFREESLVHVVHRSDEWEESEEAWELGEEEMMIVGTVQQEESCSWQDASKSWLEQDEKEEVGVYKIGTCPGDSEAPRRTGEGAATCSPLGKHESARVAEDGWCTPGPDDLLLEGEEGEYFLELLMREVPPGEPNPPSNKLGQPVGKEEGSGGKATSAKGKGKKRGKKKAPREGGEAATWPGERGTSAQKEKEDTADRPVKQARAMPEDPLDNPEVKGRGVTHSSKAEARPGARLVTTSRGECSGQEKLDS